MGERREVAACAYGTLFRDYRMDTPVEHFTEQLDHFATDSTESRSQHICPQQHHCAHFRLGKRLANSAGVTANQVQLKLAQIIRRYPHIRELPETGIDAINHLIAGNDLLDQLTRSSNA